jgi:thioredoxin:protein disulfide reductase
MLSTLMIRVAPKLALFLALWSSWASATIYTQETLPTLIKRAVVLDAVLTENQIRSSLDGVSEGWLLIEVQIETRNMFNIYRENLRFYADTDPSLGENRSWQVSVEKTPKTFQFLDPVSKKIKDGYRGQSVFEIKALLPPGGVRALGPSHKLPLLVDFQACNAELCLLPATLRLDVPLTRTLTTTLSRESGPEDGLIERWASKLRVLLEGDSFSFLSFALLFAAGLLTAFTPCVYPLYPITLGIFSRWSAYSSARTLTLSLAYCLGMTLSYASLGLLTASSGALFGSLTQSPTFLLSVGGLILLSAIFFSGLIPFQAPQFLQNFFTRPEGSVSRMGTFHLSLKAAGMGLGLGVVAAPCVGPVILALVAWLGSRFASGDASYLQGFLLLACFGAGMSLPFLILAEFVTHAKALPRVGRFTRWFKHTGTALMLAGSLFFIVPGLQLSGVLSRSSVEKKFEVYGLDSWTQERWSVLDFRADWCAACLELENETFTHYDVSSLFEEHEWDFVSIDLTTNSPDNRKIASDWSVVGLPTVLISAPGGRICPGFELYGFENAKNFLARMRRAQEQCSEGRAP